MTLRTTTLAALVVLGLLAAPAGAQCEGDKLTGSGVASDRFGDAAAVDGSTIVVGAPDENGDRGAVYVFEWNGSSWASVARLTASDRAIGDAFGVSVAVWGNVVLVGSYRDDLTVALDGVSALNGGSAYLFERPVGGWVDATETAKFIASDVKGADLFGSSVAIFGTRAVVGAPDANGGLGASPNKAGAAYVYLRPSSGWVNATESVKLVGSDGENVDSFGVSVAISNQSAIVGAPASGGSNNTQGVLYFFDGVLLGPGPLTETQLIANPIAGDRFADALDVDGQMAIVGAPHANGPLGETGTAYIFEQQAGVWSETATLSAAATGEQHAKAHFGESVGISGNRAVAGASGVDKGAQNTGSAYVFEKNATWSPAKVLSISENANSDELLGRSVAISGENVVVGVPRDQQGGIRPGAAHTFIADCSVGTTFCYGDGTDGSCPCGTTSAPGEGCLHSGGKGMKISATGTESLAADNLRIEVTDCPRENWGAFIVGTASQPGTAFREGLLCVGGATHLFFGLGQLEGTVVHTGFVGKASTFFTAGQTYVFQYLIRDNGRGPNTCGLFANTSPALSLTLTP